MRSIATGLVLAGCCGLGAVACGGEGQARQIIVLKLDDVTWHGAHGEVPVSPRWQRVADFVEQSHIKASFGIIGFSLERDNPAYFNWIKDLHRKGIVEFWNHGYKERKAADKEGEFEGPLDEQRHSLQRTQTLAKEKLGLELKVFGQHWSGVTADTEKALAEIPAITMWFYGPKDSTKFVFERVLTLENPTFVPDFDKFKERYERLARNKPCLALQGHPNAWNDQRWAGFVKIIEYLKAQKCVFLTPSEYMASRPGRG
jgi:peptidoglycan/xylan/chitin deacetylase (PgdA/CDA1 family)